MTKPMLEVRGITAGFVPDLPILRDVSMTVPQGGLSVIIGPNGAGKSTLIKSIAGIVRISAGQVLLEGRDLTNIRPDQMAQHGIAYVPQTDNIFRSLTVRQNLDLALRGAGRTVAAERLDSLMAQFPALAAKQSDKAGALSGGQRQFLAVAMALATAPRLILMDEPSAGLSPKAAQEALDLARDLTRQGVTIVLVEQNVTQALRIADHCYILAEGRNQVDGKAADLLGDRVVADIYLGGKRLRAGA
ncbi:ABC transporter ATP-binding protein [Sagittula sp. SSi028]|uniref:ABC transporter ATP-binding protein n=1 Tax=Sagittula sp. SSi028 TaxID=3400636 RepID=UPI003AF4E8F9